MSRRIADATIAPGIMKTGAASIAIAPVKLEFDSRITEVAPPACEQTLPGASGLATLE
jgi:hypothetical protein